MGALPEPDPATWLAVARVLRPQGRRGEVAAEILTDFPARFEKLRRAFLESPTGAPEPVDVENVWPHKGRIVIKFSGVDSIDQASRLRGRLVLIPREERAALPPHHYYHSELLGCRVLVERAGTATEIGSVTEVEPAGGAPLLHVATKHGEVLIPLAQEICTRIDTEARTILIDPPENLLELNE